MPSLLEDLTINTFEEGKTSHEATFSERYDIWKEHNKITIVLLPNDQIRKSTKEIVDDTKRRFKIDDQYVLSCAYRIPKAGYKMVFYKK